MRHYVQRFVNPEQDSFLEMRVSSPLTIPISLGSLLSRLLNLESFLSISINPVSSVTRF